MGYIELSNDTLSEEGDELGAGIRYTRTVWDCPQVSGLAIDYSYHRCVNQCLGFFFLTYPAI